MPPFTSRGGIIAEMTVHQQKDFITRILLNIYVGSSSPCHRCHRPDDTEENEDEKGEVYEDDNRDGCGGGSVEET